MQYEYPIQSFAKIVDGDTVDAVIDQGFFDSTTKRFRLLDVYAPERGKPGWAESTEFIGQWAAIHARHKLLLKSFKEQSGTPLPDGAFGRWVATIQCTTDGADLNAELQAYVVQNGWSNQK